MIARGPSHQWSLGCIAISPGAENDNEATHHMWTYGFQGGPKRIRGVCVVDKNRRAIVALRRELHAAPYRFQRAQALKDFFWIAASGNTKPRCDHRVLSLKSPDEPQANLVHPS